MEVYSPAFLAVALENHIKLTNAPHSTNVPPGHLWHMSTRFVLGRTVARYLDYESSYKSIAGRIRDADRLYSYLKDNETNYEIIFPFYLDKKQQYQVIMVLSKSVMVSQTKEKLKWHTQLNVYCPDQQSCQTLSEQLPQLFANATVDNIEQINCINYSDKVPALKRNPAPLLAMLDTLLFEDSVKDPMKYFSPAYAQQLFILTGLKAQDRGLEDLLSLVYALRKHEGRPYYAPLHALINTLIDEVYYNPLFINVDWKKTPQGKCFCTLMNDLSYLLSQNDLSHKPTAMTILARNASVFDHGKKVRAATAKLCASLALGAVCITFLALVGVLSSTGVPIMPAVQHLSLHLDVAIQVTAAVVTVGCVATVAWLWGYSAYRPTPVANAVTRLTASLHKTHAVNMAKYDVDLLGYFKL